MDTRVYSIPIATRRWAGEVARKHLYVLKENTVPRQKGSTLELDMAMWVSSSSFQREEMLDRTTFSLAKSKRESRKLQKPNPLKRSLTKLKEGEFAVCFKRIREGCKPHGLDGIRIPAGCTRSEEEVIAHGSAPATVHFQIQTHSVRT